MKTYTIGVIGLAMGSRWAQAAAERKDTRLSVVYDRIGKRTEEIASRLGAKPAGSEDEFFGTPMDIAVVATPDHFHLPHTLRALSKGAHVICEKPMASTVRECMEMAAAVKKSGKHFMVGQVCRYAPGFRMARQLVREGAIGEIAFIESEYAHDYARVPGVDNWRKDPVIRRQGFLGGGCHALDLIRWIAGDPTEVFCYMNRKLLPDWPTDDTGICVFKLPRGVLGKVFVCIGAKRPYTMRTAIYGTGGCILCDNTSPFIRVHREPASGGQPSSGFEQVPVDIASHNVAMEIEDFIRFLDGGDSKPPDEVEGTRTVAFAEAALESAKTGRPVELRYPL